MKRALVLLVSSSTTYFAWQGHAAACGGCVAPPNTFTAVDSHRMVIKLGVEETILWDQFVYSGAPEEFAWVLPVPSTDVVVELAAAEFVQTIDALTAPVVQPASPPPCAASAGGCGGSGFAPLGPGPVDGVEVYDRAVVGPYETVTLGADDPNALYTWLAINGYAYPQTAVDTLDHYLASGSAFVVLRLRPGEQVSAMQPVRVRFRGFMGTFPLKMVVVGAGGVVDLSLWVIAEQRYAAANYPTTTIDERELAWDWRAGASTYDELFDEVVARHGGRGWITEYAGVLEASELAGALQEAALADYVAATAQVHYPYLTRLRTSMLVEHLDQDLQLAPAEDASDVPRELFAQRDLGYECEPGAATAMVAPASRDAASSMSIVGLAVLAVCVRTSRRRRS